MVPKAASTHLDRSAKGRWWAFVCAVILLLPVHTLEASSDMRDNVLQLHPANPHYLLFRGEPTVLITSAEHYGAVLNLDFDYKRYLEELARCGLNLTRTFSGVYCESPNSFGIKNNTLAPQPGRLLAPWARSDQPGYAGGGNKFDLDKWNPAYFDRLIDFVRQAGSNGVVVELVLFCPFYEDEMWNLSPMKDSNNINGIGACPRTEVYTLQHKDLLDLHEALTREIVRQLKDFDNVYYEICNEPYFGGVTDDWQARIAATIQETEKDFPFQHLIAQNIANQSQKVTHPHPAVSIFNFHYAYPPDTVAMNWDLNRPIGDDETGFRGSTDFVYRREGWSFILAGGAIYNNLDYSFSPNGYEDGSAPIDAPGGGGAALRGQLRILKDFIYRFDFVRMTPDHQAVSGLTEATTAYTLSEPGKAYAVYLQGENPTELILELPNGTYLSEWIDTKTGLTQESPVFHHSGGKKGMLVPPFVDDIALRVVATED
jgi:hypothetical protein